MLPTFAGFAALLLGAALGGRASAQYIAYPQDAVQSRSGTVVPLGAGGSPGSFVEETRWQQLIPAEFLPTQPTLIYGLAAVAGGLFGAEVPMDYRWLRITMSHAPTPRDPVLLLEFASNLGEAVVVLDRRFYRHTWTEGQWGTLLFDRPFPYNGRNHLVIEIRKEVEAISTLSMNTPGNPGRPDLPSCIQAIGPVGSGAAHAPVATASSVPLQVRLLVEGPTVGLRSEPFGSVFGNVFALGSTMELRVAAAPGSVYLAWLGEAFAPRFELPGVGGAGWVVPAAAFPPIFLDRSGTATQEVSIPTAPALVGARVGVQGAAGVPGIRLTFSNGAAFLINE
jgi:hypothetical protein